MRRVKIVQWAQLCERPRCIPVARRLKGTKAKGLAYERSLSKALLNIHPAITHGQWYEFSADGEHGYCQPDFVFTSLGALYVIECKLTNVEEATEQLLHLYFPILRKAYELPVRGIIVARSVHRVPALATIVSSLTEAVIVAKEKVPVLHWIGHGPI